MGNRKGKKELEPMPRTGWIVIGVVLLCFAGLALLTGNSYLQHWRGETVFLPFVLFIGLLLIAVIVGLVFRVLNRKRKP
jgi:H+/Cl- antiporter ClcA